MPTLVAALSMAALLKMAHVEMPRWHLAFCFAVLVGATLRGSGLGGMALLANTVGTFLGAWAYFVSLYRTDNTRDAPLHYVILFAGMGLLLGSRFWLDVRKYGIAL